MNRVLLCPEGMRTLVDGREDRRSPTEARNSIALLAAQYLSLAAVGFTDASTGAPQGSHEFAARKARTVSNKDSGIPYIQEGEVGLWQLKAAGYHIFGPENFIAHTIPEHFFFRFKDGHLVTDRHQMRAAHHLLTEVKAKSRDFSQQNITKELAVLAGQYKPAEGYGWQVITGTHETESGLSVALLAFGEYCSSQIQQKQQIQTQRASQLSVYSRAASTELARARVKEPSTQLVGGLGEILFSNNPKNRVIDVIALLYAQRSALGFYITPLSLADAISVVYQVAWSSAYSTEQSKKGRFTPQLY